MLSEGRSGTNWLNSIADSTKQMGRSGEWLARHRLEQYRSKPSVDEILVKTKTDNDRFAIKLFPKHVREYQDRWGEDFIKEVASRHEVALVHLERRDKIAQAISMARARMTGQWSSRRETGSSENYDFRAIARELFLISQSDAFWRAYLAARNWSHVHFYYEDLVSDPQPYFAFLADKLDVPEVTEFKSHRTIQRDQVSEEWRRRFFEDAQSANLTQDARPQPTPRTIRNFVRFLAGAL
ncbi:Stf0 family sulfotransferase [Ferirhizobium litorale]|uniref:Stf0 family sulfotransferase n=1 Tax=Ferirhizobium litorale TaxID=2927786 RepID=A0AAE3QEB5_9HYPH|nr:Stf0 family sulfotransferase [Fererhizobium litorale]MDI7923416.1 Stf0 family sulfotransferase [Fererhizobium litorale]